MTGRFRTFHTPFGDDSPEQPARTEKERAEVSGPADTQERSSSSPFRIPELGKTPGAAVFWPCGAEGWDHPPLLFPSPVLVLRVNRATGTTVETPDGTIVARHDDCIVTPFQWIDEILGCLDSAGHGTSRKLFLRPVCPLAVVGASYEFGRFFNPHEGCFPHAANSEVDDLVVGFHCTGFARIDGKWNLIGRPPSRRAKWRDWRVPEEATAWPRPPLIGRDAFSPTGEESSAFHAGVGRFEPPAGTMTEVEYGQAFDAIQRHLHRGDIYQANLTVRFDGKTGARPERIFRRGLEAGGDRYAMLLRASGCTHVSFSPELFARKWGRSICTKPVKGTLRLAPDESTNETARKLAGSNKDKAEHVMIVDLERNDLGRICEYGSVRVDPLMQVTVHPTLLHLESTVYGTLRSRVTCRDVFAALFPGGSVTGAPKRRAMEILGKLEATPRGIYCGAMGWIDSRGDMELNLPIRTATVFDDGRTHLNAGGGIVADSDVREEMAEIRAKMKFVIEAIKRASG